MRLLKKTPPHLKKLRDRLAVAEALRDVGRSFNRGSALSGKGYGAIMMRAARMLERKISTVR